MRIGRLFKVAPLAVAIGLGPLIDVLTFLVRSEGGQSASVSLVIRGGLIVLLLASLRRSRTLAELRGLLLPLVLLGAYGLVWTAVRADALDGFIFSMRALFLVAVYLSAFEAAALGLVDARWMERIAWLVVALAVGSQAAGHLAHVSSVYESDVEFPGITGEPSVIAAAVCTVLPLFAVDIPLRKRQVLGVLVAVASIVGTQRRSAIIAAAAGLAVFGLVTLLKERRTSASGVIGLLGGAAGAIYFIIVETPLGAALALRFEDLNVVGQGTASGRTEFQRLVVDHLLRRDLADLVFGEALGAVTRTLEREFGMAIGSHNDWLDILFAFGLVGGALFVWFHVRLLRAGVRARAGLAAVAGMGIVSTFVLGVTAGGTLDPSSAPTLALFGFLAGTGATARSSVPATRKSTRALAEAGT